MRFLVTAATVVVSLATLTAQDSRPVSTKSDDAQILALLKARVDAGRNIGIVAATIDADGKKAIAAYGNPGPGSLPLDADSVFEIGSITKVFTAILLADMADRGEVKLDDPVAKYLPRLPDNMMPADARNPYVDYSVAQLYEFLSRHELRRDPGELFEYSNLGVGLLGHVLALRAGKSYAALVKDRILDPLDMDHTAITFTPWMTEHLAKGHNNAGAVVMNWDVGALNAAGGLRSTMNDMLKFALANLQTRGRPGSPPRVSRRGGVDLQQVMQRTHIERAPPTRRTAPTISVSSC